MSSDKTKESAVSYFSFSGLRPCFSRLVALPLSWLGFTGSNFAKKNKRLLAVYSLPSCPLPHCFLVQPLFSTHLFLSFHWQTTQRKTPKNWQLCRLLYSLLAFQNVIQVICRLIKMFFYNSYCQRIFNLW